MARIPSQKWSSKEDVLLVELKEAKRQFPEIARKLKKLVGVSRTKDAIHQRMFKLRKEAKTKGISVTELVKKKGGTSTEPQETPEEGSLIYRLRQYDEEHLYETLRKRGDFLYGLMAEQAKQIELYGSLAKYQKLSFSDLMNLSVEERGRAARLLESPPKPDALEEIGILTSRNYSQNDTFSVVLPITLNQARKSSGMSLASCLNDAVLSTCLKGVGLKAKDGMLGRFRDLVRYNLHLKKDLNLEKSGEEVTEFVTEEYPAIQGVYFFEDSLTLYDRLEE